MSEISETIANQVLTEAFPILNDVGIIHKGEYNPATQYVKNNVVTYLGSSYMCTIPSLGIVPINTSNWQLLASKGDKGIVFQWKGTYSPSNTYEINDAVVDINNKTIYTSLVANNINNPLTDNTKWELLMTVDDLVTTVNSAIDTINTTNTNVTNVEASRVTVESVRVSAESGRLSAESSRSTAESNRVSAESGRAGNESIRQSQETTRQSQETTRQTNTTTAINNLNTAVSNVIHKGIYNASTSYVKNNSVSLNGNTWRCLQNSTGNSPVEGVYWTLEAAKGADGAGTVAGITSTTTGITVAGTAQNPTLTLNPSFIYAVPADVAMSFGGRFKIIYTSSTDTLDIFEI